MIRTSPYKIVLDYQGGGSLNGATFARTSAAMRHKRRQKLESIAAGIPRADWIRNPTTGLYEPHTLVESARVQLVTNPENFGAWTQTGTPGVTGGQADPAGGTAAYLLDDNDAASVEEIYQAVGFTGDGTKAAAVFLKGGTSLESELAIRDQTAGVLRHQVKVLWTAGSGVPALSTISGAGLLFPVRDAGYGWWRCLFNADNIVAANTNALRIRPTSATASAVGTVFAFGANAWNHIYPATYQGPSLGTRQPDSMTWPFPHRPRRLFVYEKFIERGNVQGAGVTRRWRIGSTSGGATAPFLLISFNTVYGTRLNIGGVITSATVATVPAYGDVVEMLTTMTDAGVMQVSLAVNGGAPVIGSASAAAALPPSWIDNTFYWGGAGEYYGQIRRLIVGLEPPASLAQFRDYLDGP